ncbi:hypothetical protein Tco_0847742, partial [Tanacetum coccineum]
VIFGSIPIGACEVWYSSWRGSRVDGRTYLLSGVIDDSEANRIIRDPKLELESSRFTFDLVSPSYESVDVVVGENWMLRHKAEMDLVGFTPCRRIGFRMELVQGATPICEGSCRLTSLERKEVWNDCRSCKVRVGSNGNLLWKAPVLLGRKKVKNIFRMRNGDVEVCGYAFWANQYTSGFHGVNEQGREGVREFFQQHGSEAKRKLSRCGRNQMGNEPILALSEGAEDFAVYYDVRSKDLEACLEKERRLDKVWISIWRDVRTLAIEEAYMTNYSIQPGADTVLCDFRLWVVKGLTLERYSKFGKKDKLEPSYVGPFEIFGYIGLTVWLRISVLWGEYRKLDWEVIGCFFSCGVVVLLIAPLRGGHKLKHNMIVLEKVRGDLKHGPEFTWERKDQMRSKCPQLFVDSANASCS